VTPLHVLTQLALSHTTLVLMCRGNGSCACHLTADFFVMGPTSAVSLLWRCMLWQAVDRLFPSCFSCFDLCLAVFARSVPLSSWVCLFLIFLILLYLLFGFALYICLSLHFTALHHFDSLTSSLCPPFMLSTHNLYRSPVHYFHIYA